mgnify:FL=1
MQEKHATQALCQEICLGCAMAGTSIRALTRRAREKDIALALNDLRHRYAALEAAAAEMLKQSGGRPRKARVPRAADCVTIYARTMFDRSPARLAGIVLTGFSKGGAALEEALTTHPDASREAKALCRRVLAVQEQERPRFQRYCRARR